ncbi:hypothetical protein JRO89_XS01G0112800 [Xanthoceras sorbifolium]|uniref:RRM domain-containing protein n=1 Tax=Xanthoceras sorbifolium TaxID=99658 RepID=A0ABQ8IJ26_9ROSI|nr:hypothetical protein JRO89_XS01G0112800 [Xanthoceras sorbifolium]
MTGRGGGGERDRFRPRFEEKSRGGGRANAPPSRHLWVGNLSHSIEEADLTDQFLRFGELESVAFQPGRSYAFVNFLSEEDAIASMKALQGFPLAGNPLRIEFAKAFCVTSMICKGSTNTLKLISFFPRRSSTPARHASPTDPIYSDKSKMSDKSLFPIWRDRKDYCISRGNCLEILVFIFVLRGVTVAPQTVQGAQNLGSFPGDHSIRSSQSPASERIVHFHDFPQKDQHYEDQWDLPEDDYYHPGTKKLKTGSFPPDKELPEYPFSDLEQEKRAFSRTFSDFPQPEAFNKNFDAGPFGYKQIPDHRMNQALPQREKNDHWKAPYDSYQAGSGSLPPHPVERKRFTPESDLPSLKDWKWDGTIAKGGTPVCRARCFPVGKVMDMMLPEFLDCTARTSLDMLAKHYYQASGAWVVFFVPGSDADMGCYNEFMHYLEEKQRAAVAKLDDSNTLFLVPPSDFSEKVLKVPGKLSISGVVLRLEHPSSSHGSLHYPNEVQDTNLLSFNGDASYLKSSAPSGSFPPLTSFPDIGKSGSGINNLSFAGDVSTSAPPTSYAGSLQAMGSMSDPYSENRHEYAMHQRNTTLGPNQSPHNLQNNPISHSHYTGGIPGIPLPEHSNLSHQETKPSVSLPGPIASLQSDQLAQLASTLLGQQRQAANSPNLSIGESHRQTSTGHQSDNPYRPSQSYAMQTQLGVHGSQQLQNTGNQETDGDPQKRLQATLQLAAALLQQIQRGKGT